MTNSLHNPLSKRDILESFRQYDVPRDIAYKASTRIHSRDAMFLIVSGKQGAGKDTIAPVVMERLQYLQRSHVFFAKPLKTEVSDAITTIRNVLQAGGEQTQAVLNISNEMGIPVDDAVLVVERLWDEVAAGVVTDAYVRTPNTRFALQHWGTDIRRSQDENYWVKKALLDVAESVASEGSVFVTDARFPNEVDGARSIGAFTVRLDVSEEEQAKRIYERDGIVLSDEAKNHVSETALDDYPGFDIRVQTDNLTVDEIVDIIITTINNDGE